MDGEEFLSDELEVPVVTKRVKQPQNSEKQVITTQKSSETLKFSDNNHIADLQQRVIRLEYELLFMKDKLFQESRTQGQPKLSPYGKIVKRRIAQNG